MKVNKLRKVTVSTTRGMVDVTISEVIAHDTPSIMIEMTGTWAIGAITGSGIGDPKRVTRIGIIGLA